MNEEAEPNVTVYILNQEAAGVMQSTHRIKCVDVDVTRLCVDVMIKLLFHGGFVSCWFGRFSSPQFVIGIIGSLKGCLCGYLSGHPPLVFKAQDGQSL